MATSAKTKAPPAPNVGALIDQMWAEREEKRKYEALADEASKRASALEEQIIEQMDAQGLTKSTGSKATVSFTYGVSADVQGEEGWNKFYAYIKKTGYFHLLHRRIADAAYKELLVSLNGGGEVDVLKAKKQIPGLSPFLKKRVNLRTLSI